MDGEQGFRQVADPRLVRFPLAAAIWLMALGLVGPTSLRGTAASIAFAALVATVLGAMIAARRFERQRGAAYRRPIQFSAFMMWLLGVPIVAGRERWELPLAAAMAFGLLAIGALVAIGR